MSALSDDAGRCSAGPFIAWGVALLDDPQAALSDLLSGRGERGAQQRAEPDDFLADLLVHPGLRDQRSRLTEGLDAALLSWLTERIEWPPARISGFGTRAYMARISDALKVAARLPLNGTAQELIRNQATWDNRFRGLRWPGDIDLLRQFDRVLAQHQTDTRFVSRWFAACDEAAWGSPHWQTSLSTGLIGLRKLPVGADAEPERRVAAALGRFAVQAIKRGMSPLAAQTAFQRRAVALTVLYPRQNGHWQEIWDGVLEELPPGSGEESLTIRTRWLDHVLEGGDAGAEQPLGGKHRAAGRVAGRRVALPDAERRKRISGALDRARLLGEDLWAQVQAIIHAHWEYASWSGDSYHAGRTTHDLCNRILRRFRPDRPVLIQIRIWTLQAIAAEPENAYAWDLWAKVLSVLGEDGASLSVRWESIRRFPGNCVLRNTLARTLWKRHRVPPAENLLRETMRDFPGDAVCRAILAELLAQTGRESEAERLLRATTRDFPGNAVCRNILAELLARTGRESEAEHLLRETMRDFPGDAVCRNILAELLARTGRESEVEHLLRETVRGFPDNAVCRNILAELLARTGRESEAEHLLRETMRDFPGDAVCRAILAELLAQIGRESEAENLLRETMRDFPRDVVSRHILVRIFLRQGRREEATTEFATLNALAPHNAYVRSLAETMDTDQVDRIQVVLPDLFEYSVGELDTDKDTEERLDPWITEDREVRGEGIDAEPEILGYLDRLVEQMPLLEAYFTPSERAGGIGASLDALAPDEIAWDLELVAAHRAGLMEGPEGRERIEAWVSVHPSSYSARLLLAWQGRAGNGLDRDAIAEISREFPENRRWNDWLCYGFLPAEERGRLRKVAGESRDETVKTFWNGRLSEVYPDLKQEETEREDGVDYDPVALKRLLEDVAFAGADRAFPSISIS